MEDLYPSILKICSSGMFDAQSDPILEDSFHYILIKPFGIKEFYTATGIEFPQWLRSSE